MSWRRTTVSMAAQSIRDDLVGTNAVDSDELD